MGRDEDSETQHPTRPRQTGTRLGRGVADTGQAGAMASGTLDHSGGSPSRRSELGVTRVVSLHIGRAWCQEQQQTARLSDNETCLQQVNPQPPEKSPRETRKQNSQLWGNREGSRLSRKTREHREQSGTTRRSPERGSAHGSRSEALLSELRLRSEQAQKQSEGGAVTLGAAAAPRGGWGRGGGAGR